MTSKQLRVKCSEMVPSPFTCSVDNAPSDVQMGLINLPSDTLLAEHFRSVPLLEFYSSLKEENFPHSEDSSPLWIYPPNK